MGATAECTVLTAQCLPSSDQSSTLAIGRLPAFTQAFFHLPNAVPYLSISCSFILQSTLQQLGHEINLGGFISRLGKRRKLKFSSCLSG